MAEQWITVPSFGGGLNFRGHPTTLRDDEWTAVNGVMPKEGVAEFMPVQTKVINGSDWLPASNTVIGIVQDLFTNDSVLVPIVNNGTGVVRLFRIGSTGGSAEVSVSGTAPQGDSVRDLRPHIFNGVQVMPVGFSSGVNGLLQYNGTNFSRLTPGSGTVSAKFLVPAAGHLVAAYTDNDQNRIRIGSGGSLTDWAPDISNDADEFDLDSPGLIQAVQVTQDVCVIQMSTRLYALRSTGGIPPFTVALLYDGASIPPDIGLMTDTPHGLFYASDTDIFRGINTPWGPGRKIRGILPNLDTGMLWDSFRGELICHADGVVYRCDVLNESWHSYTAPITIRSHCYVQRGVAGTTTGFGHYMLASNGDIYRYRDLDQESVRTDVSGYTGASVTSKVFALGEVAQHVDRVRVHFEPARDYATDAVSVRAWVRQDFYPTTTTATASLSTVPPPGSFTTVGTVSSATSTELPVRLNAGRYVQWQFAYAAGCPRIRGFSFRVTDESDKKR